MGKIQTMSTNPSPGKQNGDYKDKINQSLNTMLSPMGIQGFGNHNKVINGGNSRQKFVAGSKISGAYGINRPTQITKGIKTFNREINTNL